MADTEERKSSGIQIRVPWDSRMWDRIWMLHIARTFSGMQTSYEQEEAK